MAALTQQVRLISDDYESGPSNRLVRTLSDQLQLKASSDALSRGLTAKAVSDRHTERHPDGLRAQWSLFLLDARELAQSLVPDEEVILLEQGRKLYAAWEKFRQGLPKEQKQELDGQLPDIRYLFRVVNKASETWHDDRGRRKSGRLKQIFSDLCGGCKNHSKLLSVIPTDDKYVCLLTGSLSAVAQASINHQEIADGVASSLEELSHDIAYWNDLLVVHGDVKILHRYIRDLYVVVFEFLTEIFDKWSRSPWKRFVSSFDEDSFNRLFTEKHRRIRAIERRMKRATELESQRKLHSQLQDMASHQKQLMEDMRDTVLCQQDSVQSMKSQRTLILGLGADFQRFLEQQTCLDQPDSPQSPSDEFINPSSRIDSDLSDALYLEDDRLVPELASDGHSLLPQPLVYEKKEILIELRTVLDQVGRDMQDTLDLTDRAKQWRVDTLIQNRLLSWTTDTEADRLWIQGPHGVNMLSQNCLTAICLTALSEQSGVPCISYFCSLNFGPNRPTFSSKLALNSMIRSFIVQLVLLLPERIATSADLSKARFSALAGQSFNVEDAILLLSDLRAHVPKYLHCVIDNVQLLEDRSDPQFTRDLLLILAALCRLDRYMSPTKPDSSSDDSPADEDDGDFSEEECSVPVVTKMCFTTDGYMDGLAQLAAADLVEKIEYLYEADEPFAEEATGLVPHWSREMD